MFSLILATLLQPGFAADTQQENTRAVPLLEAIQTFNAESKDDPIGRLQSPLTEEEVIAAIRSWEPGGNSPVSNALLARFKEISVSKELPEGAAFETLTGYDPGGEHVFDVWSVRIRLERADGSSFAFQIRERMIASRTLAQELERLEGLVAANPEMIRQIGGYRMADRIESLKRRIAELEVKE